MRLLLERSVVAAFVALAAVSLYSCRLFAKSAPDLEAPTPTLPLGRGAWVEDFHMSGDVGVSPGLEWTYGTSGAGYVRTPQVATATSTRPGDASMPAGSPLFVGVVAVPAQVQIVGGSPRMDLAQLFFAGRELSEGDAALHCLAWEVLEATSAGIPLRERGRWTDGRAALSADKLGIELVPRTSFSNAPGAPEAEWARIRIEQRSEEIPDRLTWLPWTIPAQAGPAPIQRFWQRDFLGDWHAPMAGPLCTQGGTCVELLGDLYVRVEVVPGTRDVRPGERGTLTGWGFFRGKVDGEETYFYFVLVGAPDSARRARVLLAFAVDESFTEDQLYTVLAELEVEPESRALSARFLGQELRFEHLADNAPPTLSFLTPTAGARVPVHEPIELTARFHDVEDGALPDAARVEWLDGETLEPLRDAAMLPPAADTLRASWTPVASGPRRIVCRVRDLGGKVTTAERSIQVLGEAPNEPVIVHPTLSAAGGVGGSSPLRAAPARVLLEGCAYDADDGELDGAALRWESDLDGPLGAGRVLDVALATPGQHLLTLRATDSEGRVSEVARSVSVLPYDGVALAQVRISQPGRVYCSPDLFARKGDTVLFDSETYGLGAFGSGNLTWELATISSSGTPGTRTQVGKGKTLALQVPDDGSSTSTRYILAVTVRAAGRSHSATLLFHAFPRGFTID